MSRFDGKELGLVAGSLARLRAVTPQVVAAAERRALTLPTGSLSPLYLLKLLESFKAGGHTPSQEFTQAMVVGCEEHVQFSSPELMSRTLEALRAVAAGQSSTSKGVPTGDAEKMSGHGMTKASARAGLAG
jgi:hypothetical protein